MGEADTTPRSPGRPRSSIDATVFAATLSTVAELGYTRATVDRIAAAAGIAKTTIYRRWPSKGALIVACLLDEFGMPPLEDVGREELLEVMIRYAAQKISLPGVGAAFAGVFTDAMNDPGLRELLATRFQGPYLRILQEVLDEPEHRVLYLIDVVVGTLLHRMGMTGRPMVESDVDTMVQMIREVYRRPDQQSSAR